MLPVNLLLALAELAYKIYKISEEFGKKKIAEDYKALNKKKELILAENRFNVDTIANNRDDTIKCAEVNSTLRLGREATRFASKSIAINSKIKKAEDINSRLHR